MQRYKEFKLRIIRCNKCKKDMIHASLSSLNSAFNHNHRGVSLDVQLKEADMVVRSGQTADGGLWGFGEESYLCVNCKNLFELKCYNCKEVRLFKDIKFTCGDPPDALCRVCYATIPAKEWKDLIKKLEELHRWDYE